MNVLLKFPAPADRKKQPRQATSAEGQTAEILFFPGVRYSREGTKAKAKAARKKPAPASK